jgi:hypothetical protein
MPRTKLAAGETVIAWQGFATEHHTVGTGTILPASDPAVRERPDCFIAASAPQSEWPNPLAVAARRPMARATRTFPVIGARVPRSQRTHVRVEGAGGAPEHVASFSLIMRGDILPAGDAVVLEYRDHFEMADGP